MKISEIQTLLDAECVQTDYTDLPIAGVYTGDLLSDVMAHARENSVLVTIQAHKNTVAVASLKDLCAIVLCNNRPVTDDMIEAARAENIAIFRTKENQFIVSGKLYVAFEKTNEQ